MMCLLLLMDRHCVQLGCCMIVRVEAVWLHLVPSLLVDLVMRLCVRLCNSPTGELHSALTLRCAGSNPLPAGETLSEGGFAPNKVAAASVLDVQEATDNKGKKYYKVGRAGAASLGCKQVAGASHPGQQLLCCLHEKSGSGHLPASVAACSLIQPFSTAS